MRRAALSVMVANGPSLRARQAIFSGSGFFATVISAILTQILPVFPVAQGLLNNSSIESVRVSYRKSFVLSI
jgi:hypothetical protein